jgi:hypothetical protein
LGRFHFDWRWIALIVVVAVLVNAGRIPRPATALVLAGAGVYVLVLGWRVWVRSGGVPSRSRVTYWRGQRFEVAPPRRGPALPRWSDIGPAALYFIIGGVLVLAGVAMTLRTLGI